ncbi:hypothetical protein EST38_g7556 [Candolleomyces aberdarensis]|uniref:Uncharacterized protein n=1 Tax=Candolleomyces aberdarensis TaxID=2316362 RepID=A0A4V1Q3E4_9AGAR|nr:hypothetical protein EST38_g7556 [Candolleomyces aberdarensis]
MSDIQHSGGNNPLKRKVDDDCDGIDDGHGEADEEDGSSGVGAAPSLEPGTVKNKSLSTSEPLPTSTSTATATATSKTSATTTNANGSTKNPPQATNGAVVPEEYKNGYILCQICGLQVDIRDRETGEFTVRMWDEHRERCFPNSSSTARGVPASSSAADVTIYTPESTAQSLAHPPTKRRRAKRTEDERIDYLRADPYVAQFEAYRVLCASCDKWIRLRPNSTYCSIPWDAHRKSCLAKKINNKSAYALDQRNALFTKDPDIRKYDAERVLCNRCDQWLSMPPEDHYSAVQKWLNHRADCSKTMASSSMSGVRRAQKAADIGDFKSSSTFSSSRQPTSANANANGDEELDELMSDEADGAHEDEGAPGLAHGHNTRGGGRRKVKPSPSSSSSSDSGHSEDDAEGDVDVKVERETKRRRLDGPSSSRSYLAHHPSHSGRLGPVPSSSSNAKRNSYPSHPHHPQTQNYASPYTLDRSNGFGRRASGGEVGWRNARDREYSHHAHHPHPHGGSRPGTGYSSTSSSSRRVQPHQQPSHQAYQQRERERGERDRQWDHDLDPEDVEIVDVDAEGEVVDDVDGEGEIVEVDGHRHHTSNGHHDGEPGEREKHVPGGAWARAPSYHNTTNNGRRGNERSMAVMRRPMAPVGLADLDSVGGRKQFLASSIIHLFATTYESTDDLPISSLLTYLNAAMPVDKHEDFDTAEVVKYVVALSGMPAGSAGGNGGACGYGERIGDRRWRVLLEGDIVRIVD